MSFLVGSFFQELEQYRYLAKRLHDVLDECVQVTAVKEKGFGFTPTQSTILTQIKHWPEGEFKYPPAAWVQPRTGTVELNNSMWEYLFHGSGLSFIHSQTKQDLSIEYTETGEIGITKWTIKVYLESTHIENVSGFLMQLDSLIEEAVTRKYLLKTPPLFGLGNGDQTYTFLSEIG